MSLAAQRINFVYLAAKRFDGQEGQPGKVMLPKTRLAEINAKIALATERFDVFGFGLQNVSMCRRGSPRKSYYLK